MSLLIMKDLNSFSFLSIIVLKSPLLTEAADFLAAKRLFGV